jgi:hypothetical protein
MPLAKAACDADELSMTNEVPGSLFQLNHTTALMPGKLLGN